VYVSEYTAPDDIPVVAEWDILLNLRRTVSPNEKREVRTERLYRLGAN
jgi:hypothetical protein